MTPDEAFEQHRPLAARVALAYLRKLPSSIERREIKNIALGGLWETALRHHALPKLEFEAMAIVRIRGAIADELRARDHFPRRVRQGYGESFRMLNPSDFDTVDALRRQHLDSQHLEEVLDEHAEHRWLASMMERLPPQQRLMVERLLAGESQREIADSLGLTPVRVCQVVGEARQDLEQAWQRHRDRVRR